LASLFQSKEFQKTHWKFHKRDCRLNVEMAKKAEALGRATANSSKRSESGVTISARKSAGKRMR
jgi:hypothetical protein